MNDLRFTVRQLIKKPGFTAVAVVSLALGIGLNSAVFSIINTIFLQSIRGIPQPEKIVFFNQSVSFRAYEMLRDNTSAFSGMTAAIRQDVNLVAGNVEARQLVEMVTENYFSTLGVTPAIGRFFPPDSQHAFAAKPEAVLTYNFWKSKLGGNPSVIGSTLKLNGSSFTIIGVANQSFHGAGPEGPPVWIPLGSSTLLAKSPVEDIRKNRKFGLLGRLKPEFTLAQAQFEVERLRQSEPLLFDSSSEAPNKFRLSLGRESWSGETSREKQAEFLLVTTVPLVVVGVVLWIACSNVSNLLLARAVARQREIAIRLATGASRWRIVRLLMTESLALALLGGVLGLLVGNWTIDFVFATLSDFNNFSIQLDGRVLAYTTGISFLAALLFGLVPAFQAARAEVNNNLKNEDAAFKNSRLRSFFLMSQLASSLALLVVAGTFVKSLLATRSKSIDDTADQLAVAQLPLGEIAPARRVDYVTRVIMRLAAMPEVEAVSRIEDAGQRARWKTEVAATNNYPLVVTRVNPAFFRVTGGTLLQGSNFETNSPSGQSSEVVVNEAAAQRFQPRDKVFSSEAILETGEHLHVIGIVHDGMDTPNLYTRISDEIPAHPMLFIRTREAAVSVLGKLRSAVRSIDAQIPFASVESYRTMALGQFSRIGRIAVLIGGLALSLAAAGLYASVAFTTSQRTREIGVRMALGASRASVIRLILKNGFKLVSTGSLIGLALALGGLRLLTGLLFGKWPLDLVSLFGVLICFGIVTLLACLIPARRAAQIDPMVALRHE